MVCCFGFFTTLINCHEKISNNFVYPTGGQVVCADLLLLLLLLLLLPKIFPPFKNGGILFFPKITDIPV